MATTAEAVASAFAAEDDNSTSFLEWSANNTFDSPIREDADEEEELRFSEPHQDVGHVHERVDSSSGDGDNEDSSPEQEWVIVETAKSAPLPSVGQSRNLQAASLAVSGGLWWCLGPIAGVAAGCLSGLLLQKEREFSKAVVASWSSTGISEQGAAGGSTMQVAVTEDQRQMYLTFWRFDTKVDLFKAEVTKWVLQALRQGGDSVRKYVRGDLDAAMQQLDEARQREMEALRAQEDRDQLLRQLIQGSGLVDGERQLDDSGVSVPVSREEVIEQVEKVVQTGQAALAELEGLRRVLINKDENLEDMKTMALELQNEMHKKDMEHHHEQEEQQEQMQRTQEAFMKVQKEKEEVEAHMTYMWQKATEQLKAKDKGIEEQKEVLEKQREDEVQRVLQEKEAAKQAFEELQKELQALQQEKAAGETKAFDDLQRELQALQQEKAAAEAKASAAEEKADKLEEGKTCIICMDKDRSVVFRPCGHVACCASCKVEACPVCRVAIDEAVSFYHS